MKRVNKFLEISGIICKKLIPIDYTYVLGSGNNIAVCTLSSINLSKALSNDIEVLKKVKIIGRLLSENKGIDEIIDFIINNPSLKYLVLCGKDGKGHLAGQSLKSLFLNGVDKENRIIGSHSPHPFLKASGKEVESFRKQIQIIDMVGIEQPDIIIRKIEKLLD